MNIRYPIYEGVYRILTWQECSKTSVSPIHRFMYQEKLTFVFYIGMGFTRNVSRLR